MIWGLACSDVVYQCLGYNAMIDAFIKAPLLVADYIAVLALLINVGSSLIVHWTMTSSVIKNDGPYVIHV